MGFTMKYITLDVGESSGFVPHYLTKLFPVAADTYSLLQKTELRICMVSGDSLEIKEIGLYVSSAQQVIPSSSVFDYVTSKAKNTYPANGNSADGYWYVYCKQLGEAEHTSGTTDLTAGTSALETGKYYWVFE